MDALTALKTRRSIRRFEPTAIEPRILEDIVDCARLAPTGLNAQRWAFIVIDNPDLLAELGRATDYGGFIARAPAAIAVLVEEGPYAVEDGAAAATTLLLAAHAHGLGGCWVTIRTKPYEPDLRARLGATEPWRLHCLVALGVPGEQPNPPKRPLAEVLHRNAFGG